ncbi:MAG: bifunctional demethylmenaquinone methyltransferase/2-methoxy-6-polyprenyl-1,4-benzoquinol methylase UbiE [Bacteroidales bacterium]|jgi:demethylmenaquinone methyltransferase/2-methoxy-6-polyprenyl-1,4-benzoquinol methylase
MKEPAKGVKYSPQQVDVKQMFGDIAPRYDFLNHFLSAGMDKRWRKKTINMLTPYQPKQILDIATGTADLAIEAMKLNPDMITGIDITEEMLIRAAVKIEKKNLKSKITLRQARSEELPFTDASFDVVMVAFGVRNFFYLKKGLDEMFRVLKKGGVVAILEFSVPSAFPIKQLYKFYFRRILPVMGKIVSKSKTAYTYLPETVLSFPQGREFTALLEKTGFVNTRFTRLSMGICSIYIAEK